MRSGPLDNLCDVPGIKVGHATDPVGITGCTAVLFEGPAGSGATVGVDVRGSSPGTRETARLAPMASVNDTHAVLLTGGSAFGLAAADGVVKFLEEKGTGLDVGVARIPLVSAAVIFDLMCGSPDARPDAAMGYEAAGNASSSGFDQGGVGAGTGATVGKILGPAHAMKGGVGSASFVFGEDSGDLMVAALAVVNAFGDVRENGETIAGPRLEDGTVGETLRLLPRAAERLTWGDNDGRNTTLALVATNARLSKLQMTKVAQMAHDGLARVINPVHATVDGDVVFAAALGDVPAATDVVGAWAAEALTKSVLRAVRSARSVGGVPGLRDT
ncbi:P1 family peptidase [Rubrobacter indicoceani]|uniref:P1 family peptidase n=1 Tax=Rubrobacter indicoceani TaxID=2051957 RepID=UPI000E5A9998|nr:P1 family peptidase [Rubrobacter indicoceani]